MAELRDPQSGKSRIATHGRERVIPWLSARTGNRHASRSNTSLSDITIGTLNTLAPIINSIMETKQVDIIH